MPTDNKSNDERVKEWEKLGEDYLDSTRRPAQGWRGDGTYGEVEPNHYTLADQDKNRQPKTDTN